MYRAFRRTYPAFLVPAVRGSSAVRGFGRGSSPFLRQGRDRAGDGNAGPQKDQAGKTIATGKAAADPANRNVLVVPIGEHLLPGNYKVEWHAVAEDTHRVRGNYSFSVDR
jgi:hypothetical protein